MAATIELKYFNTFWLKKIKTITDVVPDFSATIVSVSGVTFTIGAPYKNPDGTTIIPPPNTPLSLIHI